MSVHLELEREGGGGGKEKGEGDAEYIYHLPDTAPVRRVKVVVTQFPNTYGNDEKVY